MKGLTKLIIILSILSLFSPKLFAENKKILVLGFTSEQMNDLHKRLLRESVLRQLFEKGYEIVPVMEVESLFQNNKINIGELDTKELKGYCSQAKSGYSLIGKIYPTNLKKINEIRPGQDFTCEIFLYQKEKEKFLNYKFTLKGTNTLFEFYSEISNKLLMNLQNDLNK